MGSWQRLDLSPAQLLLTYRKMEIPSLKAAASSDIVFEDVRKEAILAAVFAIRAFFERIGLVVKYRGLEHLRGRRVAFVANHQGGNLDALVLAMILFSEKGRTPYIPTSNRLLEAKVVGQFNVYLKYLGAFFIRPTFENDPDYIKSVARFMDAILDTAQYLLFYLEGDTSKGGKPLPPRRGLIKSLIAKPIVFCPVSLTYESALNDSGIHRATFAASNVISAVTTRRIGTVYVTFGTCLDGDCSPSHYEVSARLANAIYSEIPILTCDVIATLLLDAQAQGIVEVALDELQRDVQWLESEIRARELPLISKPLHSAVKALAHLLTITTTSISIKDAEPLAFYRNRALHAFYDCAQAPALLRYECNWSPSVPPLGGGSSRLRGLAIRTVAPLVAVYTRIGQLVAGGRSSAADLRAVVAEMAGTTVCTWRNIQRVYADNGWRLPCDKLEEL